MEQVGRNFGELDYDVFKYFIYMKFNHLRGLFVAILFGCSNPKTETQLEVEKAESEVVASDAANPEKPTSSNVTSPSSLITRNMLGKVEVSVPRPFKIMDEEMIAVKYPLKQEAEFQVYTDEDATVNIAFEHLPNIATLQDLPAIKQVLEHEFNQPEIDFRKSEIKKINSRDFIVIEMITPAADTRVYNLMFLTSLDGKLLMGTFNCTVNKQKEWQPIAERIVNSIKIID
jgi:hypothetical protein